METTPTQPPAAAPTRRTRSADPGSFDLWETSRRIGHYMWLEMQLFEILGAWVATVPEPEVKLQLGAQSRHHAWHAGLWHDLLPTTHEVRPEQFVVPPNNDLHAFVEALAAPDVGDLTPEKLAGVHRVALPHLITAYSHHLDRTAAVTDAPTARTLKIVIDDLQTDWRAGELLLQTGAGSAPVIERVGTHQTHLAQLLAASGGVAGPGTFGRATRPGSAPTP